MTPQVDIASAVALWEQHAPAEYRDLIAGDGWSWDEAAQTYRGRWRTVGGAKLQSIVLAVIDGVAAELRQEVATAFPAVSQKAIVPDWASRFGQKIAALSVAVTAAAWGGTKRLTADILKRVNGDTRDPKPPGKGSPPTIAFNADRLTRLVAAIAVSVPQDMSLDAAQARASKYADFSHAVFQDQVRESHLVARGEKGDAPFKFERNVLDDEAQHCRTTKDSEGCPEVTAAGWQPIGSLPVPGTRTCLTRCRCRLEYSSVAPAVQKSMPPTKRAMKAKNFGTIVEEATTGLRLPEAVARRVGELSKVASKDLGGYRRVAVTPTDFKLIDGERADVSTVSTDAKDRDGEVVLSDGMDLTEFRLNPIVPFHHQYDELPVGLCQWIKAASDSNGLIAKTHYPPKPGDWGDAPWMPSAIFHLVQSGLCKGKSIGFVPREARKPTQQELAARPEWRGATIVSKGTLLEYSIAPIPVNADAIAAAVSKAVTNGIFSQKSADLISAILPTLKLMDAEDVTVKAGGKYAHIDFGAPPHVQKCMERGAIEHEVLGHNTASPEQLAMANHIGRGGKCSPGYARKMNKWWDANEAHAREPEGSPAHTMALIHGGNGGKAFAGKIVKDMDAADGTDDVTTDAEPTPAMENIVKKAEGAHEFGAVTCGVPNVVASHAKIMATRIKAEHLHPEGVEANTHVTAKYGIHGSDIEAVRKALEGQPPVAMTLGKTSVFPANGEDGHDVVKVDVHSPGLHALHAHISKAMPNTNTHPVFQPNMTLAYCKPGEGKAYEGMDDLDGLGFTVSKVTFGGADGTTAEIPLTGEPDAELEVDDPETKAVGASEGTLADGGAAVPVETKPIAKAVPVPTRYDPAAVAEYVRRKAKEADEHRAASVRELIDDEMARLMGRV